MVNHGGDGDDHDGDPHADLHILPGILGIHLEEVLHTLKDTPADILADTRGTLADTQGTLADNPAQLRKADTVGVGGRVGMVTSEWGYAAHLSRARYTTRAPAGRLAMRLSRSFDRRNRCRR